jgi:hypothetical protein
MEAKPIPRFIDEGDDATLDKILAMLEKLPTPQVSNKKAPGVSPGGP